MLINKETKLYGSFSKKAGNVGCTFFNTLFKKHNIDAIYRSFSVNKIEDAVNAARCLGFSGFAVSMPFKKEVLKYVDLLSDEVKSIGASNTIVNLDGELKAYNTDYNAAKEVLSKESRPLYILGNGGYAAAVKKAAKDLKLQYELITRKNWNDIPIIRNSVVYNCTPVKNIETHDSCRYIDCITSTESGKELSSIQSSHQFKLYTGIKVSNEK